MNLYKHITNPKYRFFHRKIADVTRSMWELDFKIAKARSMREESRRARDNAVEMLSNLKKMPESEEQKKKVEEQENRVKGFEAQMALIDSQINGSEEQTGLMQHLDGLADLKAMYRDYVTKI